MTWTRPPLPALSSSSCCPTASAEIKVEKKELLAWKWLGCVTPCKGWEPLERRGWFDHSRELGWGKLKPISSPSLPQTAARYGWAAAGSVPEV